jgi:glycerophosphoryl diester phosphodiesterase
MPHWPYPFWLAHRGGGHAAPENTLAAFDAGAAHGFTGFECDVQLSRDGVPFLLHDATLARTTNGQGLACDTDWAQLAALDAGGWHSAAHAGEPIPTLTQLAERAGRLGWQLNLELKPSPGQAQRLGAGVAAWLRQHWRGPPPLLSSFEPEALHAAGSDHTLALLTDTWAGDATLALARDLGAVAVVGHHSLWRPDTLAATHSAGLRALAYTVNHAATAQRLRQAGIDGLITDTLTLPATLG